MKKFNFTMMLMACCLLFQYANAQIDTIRPTDKRLLTSMLKPGLRQYLFYTQNPKLKKSVGLSVWLRDIRLEKRNGEKVFEITQHWYSSDTIGYRYIYSINKFANFAPVYYSETINNITKAYNWGNDKITSADSIPANAQKGFSFNFKEPNFNWTLDIETFEMLPLAENKVFAINFYNVGLVPPQYVIYKVTGSEKLTTLDNKKVDCWKLFSDGDYRGLHYSETYWISKEGHEFLKQEQVFNGVHHYKVKIMQDAPDLLQRFSK